MTTTKSMTFTPSIEARELYLFTVNHSELYTRLINPLISGLRRKYAKGSYIPEKAIQAYYKIATEAGKVYAREFGGKFTVTERWTAAVDMETFFIDEIQNA